MKSENENCIVRKVIIAVCLWLIVFVLREWFIYLLEKLYPITTRVPNDSWWIQISLVVIIGLLYANNWKNLVNTKSIPWNRIAMLLTGGGLFVLFRYNNQIEFYHAPNWSISYIGCCFLFAVLLEAIIILCWYLKQQPKTSPKLDANAFLYDSPAKRDWLQREMHAKLLVHKIISTLSQKDIETSFCILLNEQYGAGKTSFLNMIKDESDKSGLRYIEFRPWLSDSPSSMMHDFFSLLERELRLSSPNISAMLRGYAQALSGLKVGLVELSIERFRTSQSLTQNHDDLSIAMKEAKEPVLVLIDDVDRLDSVELLSVLKMIRNTADFPYLCYVLAADKASVSMNLYKERIENSDLYLRKFFNLEISFPPDDYGMPRILQSRLEVLLYKYGVDSGTITKCIDEIKKIESIWDVFSTPRDVFRYVNLLSYTLEILKETGVINDINKLDVVLLTIVHFISPEWYKVLRDRNDKLLSFNRLRGRYYLNDEKVNALITQSVRNNLNKVQEEKTKNAGQKDKNQNTDLNSIYEEIKIDPLDALKDVIYKLFGRRVEFKTPERICYKNEYYKYFSGHYKENEISTAEAFEYIDASIDDFKSFLITLNTHEKMQSLLHKMLLYVEEGHTKNRVSVFKKLLEIASVDFAVTSRNVDVSSLYRNSVEEQIVLDLFLTRSANVETLSEKFTTETTELKRLYSEDERFVLLSVVIVSLKKNREPYQFVYGNRCFEDLQEVLIKRFIEVKLRTDPFADDTIETIPYLWDMYHVLWEEQFYKHIENSPNPMAFIYNLIKDDGGKLSWNRKYLKALVPSGSIPNLQKFSLKLVGCLPNQDVADDMANLPVGRDDRYLTEENHPFVKAAMDWHREQLKSKAEN